MHGKITDPDSPTNGLDRKTSNEIRLDILRLCGVRSWDSDFNVVKFHALCDELEKLGGRNGNK